jgi:ATP-dependent Clp protease adaptor protein ClpS
VTRYDATPHMSRGIVQGDRASPGGDGVEMPGSMSSSGPLAKVQILNDNYTPMEFVVHVLERVFEIDRDRHAAYA